MTLALRICADVSDYSLRYALRQGVERAKDDRLHTLVLANNPQAAIDELAALYPQVAILRAEWRLRFHNDAAIYIRGYGNPPAQLAGIDFASIVLDGLGQDDNPEAFAALYNGPRLRYAFYRRAELPPVEDE